MSGAAHPRTTTAAPRLPPAPRAIQKGVPLKDLLGPEAAECLAHNIAIVFPAFDAAAFRRAALRDLAPLSLLERGRRFAEALRQHLPGEFEAATDILLRSLTPPLEEASDLGLAVFFYLPHACFVAQYGLDPTHNAGRDPFEAAMRAQHALTQRFTAEFSIRPFLIHAPERTLDRLRAWTTDPSAHVRRLCSEGTRPRLPWAMRLPDFVRDPRPVLPLLEALKDDPSLYVRRSVANHLGDIAKDHPDLAFELCERWLAGASRERRWVIRHALRYPARKGVPAALELRAAARP